MRPLLLISAIVISNSLTAQENENWRLYKPAGEKQETAQTVIEDASTPRLTGKIEYIQSSRIARLDAMKKENPTLMNGYRVQIFFGKREEAQEKRGEFLRNFPDSRAYISYLAPNFRLRVGDFRSRLEAEKFKKEIARMFPGSYIVKDKIELPPLEEAATN